jgi:predicted TIM-barrel fold metal-dependent hydrolase
MIVDGHTHVNNYHDEAVDDLAACVERLQREMRRNRVDAALVLTSYKVTPGRPSTRVVVEAVRPHPNLFVVAGLSGASFREDDLEQIRPGVEEGKVKGLKIYPGYEPFYPGDPRLAPAMAFAREHHLPVMIHSGDTYTPRGKLKYAHPLHVDEVAVDNPDVDFVICHIGNPWVRDTMEVVYKNANVYTDFSGLVLGDFEDRFESYMRRQVQEMLLYGVQPEKCLYGTDWPIASMQSYLDFMEELRMPPRERKLVMSENAIRLFHLPIDGPGLGERPFGRLQGRD